MKLFPKSSSAGYAIDGGPDIPFNKITQSASTTKVVIGGREIFSQGGGGGGKQFAQKIPYSRQEMRAIRCNNIGHTDI